MRSSEITVECPFSPEALCPEAGTAWKWTPAFSAPQTTLNQILGGPDMVPYNAIRGEKGACAKVRPFGYVLALVMLIVTLTVLSAPGPASAQARDVLKEGLDYHNAGRLRDAIDVYTEVLEKNPNLVEALNWRGMAYDDLNELDKALADLNKAIQLSPNYADAYNNRGEVYRKKKMYPQAMADYRKAAKLDRTFAEPHYNMGLILEHEKKVRDALKEYETYLKLNPNAEDKKEVEQQIAALRKAPPPRRPGPPPARKPHVAKPATEKRPGVKPGERPRPRPGAGAWKMKEPAKEPAVPGGVPGMEQVPIPPEFMTFLMGLGMLANIIPLVIYIFGAVMLFLIAKKTATSLAWLAFIPVANIVLMLKVAGKPIWWLALMILLPIIAGVVGGLSVMDPTGGLITGALALLCVLAVAVIWLFICLGISDARGKSKIWGILLFLPCTNIIALAYLGLSK